MDLSASTPITQPTDHPNASDVGRYLFGDFCFEPARDVLVHRQHGTEHKLEPKVAELLCLLLQHAGQVVEQDRLQQSLWPNLVVEQNSLYQLLTKLRRLLDDSTRQPTYIKTVPKKGYCWIAAVQREHASAPTLPVTPTQPSIPPSPSSGLRDRWQRLTRWHQVAMLSLLLIAMLGLRAVASFQDDEPPIAPVYQVSDVSYALGIEYAVDAHPSQNLLAYVKDIQRLEISDKQGQVLFYQQFANRIATPAWHPTQPQLAFWHYREDSCELRVVSAQGAVSHIATPHPCDEAKKPVWQSDEELVLVLKQQQTRQAYLYRLGTKEWVAIPLPLRGDQRLVTAVRGWQGNVYYLVTDAQHNSQLIDLAGTVQLTWPYPVWLIAFDASQGAMITNDNAKHAALLAKRADGSSYSVFTTAQGLFTSVSADATGTLYAGLEAWEVDIRDKDNLPIFSTTSIDYLPVSNPLGETAFMSRRSGVCEVYLHSQNRISQLSHYQGYDYVNFLEWRPDLSMLLSNRDHDLVLYDRHSTLLQFPSQTQRALQNIGWVDNDTLFSFDGQTLRLYNLQGRVVQQHELAADNLYFDGQAQRWLVHQRQAWYQFAHSALAQPWPAIPALTLVVQLTAEQSHHMQNIRIRGNTLYWQSDWSKHDLIWQMPLDYPNHLSLLKSGNLIWHFDVTPHHELTIAQMDAMQGDIKRLQPTTKP